MKLKLLLLLLSTLLLTNNSFSYEEPVLICKKEKEIFFIKKDKIMYLLSGNDELELLNGLIAEDTQGKKRILMQDSKNTICFISNSGADI